MLKRHSNFFFQNNSKEVGGYEDGRSIQ